MINPKEFSIGNHFSNIEEPRHHNIQHKFIDIISISICAIICGSETWTQIEEYGRSKHEWFSKFLELPNGIPSHDTFGRFFSLLNPDQFSKAFISWTKSISRLTKKSVVAFDGKTLRHSYDKKNKKKAIHEISAWSHENGIVLGQIKTDEKSNEITAIPELIKLLELKDTIITIDAMGCQKNIALCIVNSGADYVLALKENHLNLHNDVELFFQESMKTSIKKNPYISYCKTIDGDHGRVEIRRYWSTSNIDWLQGKENWTGLKTIIMVERERHVDGEISTETAYYISSLTEEIKIIAHAIRNHWSIENSLHWCLDVAFREDLCRVRKKHAPENFAVLRHIALNLLKREKSLKGGIQTKRLKAGWDNNYLAKILEG